MATFSVVIVGGSVAGLTLANILERYGIEYTLLEKHHIIAPQLGASIALLPHGFYVLDQLGCYDAITSASTCVNKMESYDSDGELLSTLLLGESLEQTIGYNMHFLERRQLLQILYDKIKDKSRIHTSCEIVKIEHSDNQVGVETEDGTVFTGSIVVGADGVHSRTRREMWRIADSESPRFNSSQDRKAIKCTYSCIFGISHGLGDGLTGNQGLKTFKHDRHYLYQGGVEGKSFWFCFIKNERETRYPDIPRYTDEDKAKIAAKYQDDVLAPGVTFGDVYRKQRLSVLVPLEEFVLNRCFYRRIILIGDSFHKIHPLNGLGGNAAIDSAAYLANQLKELTTGTRIPSNDALQAAFAEFQKERKPLTEYAMKSSHTLARIEALENPLLKFMALYVVSKLPIEVAIPRIAEGFTPAATVKYLPPPPRQGIVPRDDEIKMKPRERSTISTAFWIFLFFLVGSAPFVLPRIPTRLFDPKALFFPAEMVLAKLADNPERSITIDLRSFGSPTAHTIPLSRALRLYAAVSVAALNGLLSVESYRSASLFSPLLFPVLFGSIAIMTGWEVVAPIYFALYIYSSSSRQFYYPSPRAIQLSAAKAIPFAVTLIYMFVNIEIWNEAQKTCAMTLTSGYALERWDYAHAMLPSIVGLIRSIFDQFWPSPSGLGPVFGNGDIPYIKRFFTILFLLTSTAHVLFMTNFVLPGPENAGLITIAGSMYGALIGPFSLLLSITLWILFTFSDLRRVRATDIGPVRAVLYTALGVITFGPAATLSAVWGWREDTLEKARLPMKARRNGTLHAEKED